MLSLIGDIFPMLVIVAMTLFAIGLLYVSIGDALAEPRPETGREEEARSQAPADEVKAEAGPEHRERVHRLAA